MHGLIIKRLSAINYKSDGQYYWLSQCIDRHCYITMRNADHIFKNIIIYRLIIIYHLIVDLYKHISIKLAEFLLYRNSKTTEKESSHK